MYKLPKEYKEKWIEGLKKGYEQSCHMLHNSDNGGYCAIGVALVHCSNIHPHEIRDVPNLNELLMEKYKVPIKMDLCDMIMELNDNDQKEFHEIAEWIESNVEEY